MSVFQRGFTASQISANCMRTLEVFDFCHLRTLFLTFVQSQVFCSWTRKVDSARDFCRSLLAFGSIRGILRRHRLLATCSQRLSGYSTAYCQNQNQTWIYINYLFIITRLLIHYCCPIICLFEFRHCFFFVHSRKPVVHFLPFPRLPAEFVTRNCHRKSYSRCCTHHMELLIFHQLKPVIQKIKDWMILQLKILVTVIKIC